MLPYHSNETLGCSIYVLVSCCTEFCCREQNSNDLMWSNATQPHHHDCA